jgi:hypothetical protein
MLPREMVAAAAPRTTVPWRAVRTVTWRLAVRLRVACWRDAVRVVARDAVRLGVRAVVRAALRVAVRAVPRVAVRVAFRVVVRAALRVVVRAALRAVVRAALRVAVLRAGVARAAALLRTVLRVVARVEARVAALAAALVLLTAVPLRSSRLAASADCGAKTSTDSRASRIIRMR